VRLGADFLPRLASALVLAPIVIGAAIFGGWPFEILVAIAAILVLWEWLSIIGARPNTPLLILGGCALILTLLMLGVRPPLTALMVVVFAMVASALVARGSKEQRAWAPFGVLYAAALALPIQALRGDPALGLVSLIWLLAVVWSTDIAAYFCGRLIGGPKLWPQVSPNKTWSGAIGGALFGTVAGMFVVYFAGIESALLAAPVALIVSIAGQGGDLFESAMKRRFGVKDSSHLIPGHGGMMDRLDALIIAGAVGLLIGIVRDIGGPAQGLLVW